jgi:hypothetical protein
MAGDRLPLRRNFGAQEPSLKKTTSVFPAQESILRREGFKKYPDRRLPES